MRIQGDLATYEFSDLLQWLAQGGKTGVLTVSDGDVEYQLGFEHGRIDMSSSSDPQKRLDKYLYGKGVIDQATLARAERLRDATQMMAGQVLVTLGAVNEMQLAQALRDKTEEILCELLTWEQGTFDFEGGDRPESTMVPISLEVTKLLLESMHRLDQRQENGQPEPAPAVVAPEPVAPATSPQATQAVEGLALAEVLDPDRPAEPVIESEIDSGAVEELPSPDIPSHYAVMVEHPGRLRRLIPYAAVVVLSLAAVVIYLANRQASAQSVGQSPPGKRILFTQTSGPPPVREPIVAEVPLPADAPPIATDGELEDALRERYEQQLAGLRQELQDARRLSEPVAVEPRPPVRNAEADLPANSVMRAVSRTAAPPSTEMAAAALVPSPEPVQVPEQAPAQVPEQAPEQVLPPVVEPVAEAKPATPEVVEEAEIRPPAPPPARVPAFKVTNPELMDRPTPRYPVTARRFRRGATVTLRVLVGINGRVQEVERVGPKAGLGFDQSAEEAALASTWQPGSKNGEPAAMWAELRFDFQP